jgi:cytochrome oxidase Cu insertion factor (SCO1/SenC/PrrC family)
MSDKNDTKEIVKEFLELWQKQFATMTKDPQNIASMFKMFQSTQEGYFNSLKEKSDAKSNPAPDLSDNVNDELRHLKDRIGQLEERIRILESGAGGTGRKTTQSNNARKSGSATGRTAKPAAK